MSTPETLQEEQDRHMNKRFWKTARFSHGKCRRCRKEIIAGQEYYMTHTNSITSHPVHLECPEKEVER